MQRFGSLFNPFQALWYSEDSLICLAVPDVEHEKVYAAKEGMNVIDNVLDWTPPKGLKRILPEKWALIVAEHEAAKKASI